MASPAQTAELVRPLVADGGEIKDIDNSGNQLPATHESNEQAATAKIAGALNELDHPVKTEDVSAKDSAHTIVAQVEKQGVGATVVGVRDHLNDLLKQGIQNIRRSTTDGGSHVYLTTSGHDETIGKMSLWARAKNLPQRLKHALVGEKKV